MTTPSPSSDLISRLNTRLTPAARDALRLCVFLARDQRLALFLVGGAVRDLILERDNLDLDLAVEGEVAPLANALASATNARAVHHDRFGTATVRGPGFQLDLVRTRREAYARPGALPAVEPASLVEDLARRDFTINALALRLTDPAGELIDPYHGLDDLKSSLIRVLHERSFQDDATRMLRAVRYAARLGFKVQRQTEALIRRDLPYLDAVSGPRLRREISLLFEEPSAVEATFIAGRLGLLRGIHPLLHLDTAIATRWRQALTGPRHALLEELGYCVIASPTSSDDAASLTSRLHLAGRFERALHDLVRLRSQSAKLASATPVEAVDLLDNLAPAAVWAFAVIEGGAVARTCEAYLTDWRRLRPHLTGDDLLALGVPGGPTVGEVLKELRRALLEGRAATRADEIELVRQRLEKKD